MTLRIKRFIRKRKVVPFFLPRGVVKMLITSTLWCAQSMQFAVLSWRVETASSKRSHWTRLSGALTMLVLLGVPWMFSAFGVVDAEGSRNLEMIQGIFNVSDRYFRQNFWLHGPSRPTLSTVRVKVKCAISREKCRRGAHLPSLYAVWARRWINHWNL